MTAAVVAPAKPTALDSSFFAAALGRAVALCQSRSDSLASSGQAIAANEAQKCADAIRQEMTG